MRVKDIMTAGVECVAPDDTIQAAARKMKELDVGPMPVCDRDRIAGMLTDRDITVRAVAEGKDPKTTRVRDTMTEDVIFCFEDQDLDEAARMMQERQVRRILVLNRDRRLTGIVSLGDLAAESGDKRRSGEILQDLSEPSTPRR